MPTDILEIEDHEVRSEIIGLQAVLGRRWSNGNATPEEMAGWHRLTSAEVRAVFLRRGRPGIARQLARIGAVLGSFRSRFESETLWIQWSKFAEFQEYRTRTSPEVAPVAEPSRVREEEEKSRNPQDRPSGPPPPTDSTPPPPRREINGPALELAGLFARELLRAGPQYVKTPSQDPKALQPWAREIDRMLRLDHVTLEDAREVIPWVVRDTFWGRNILSARKLRQHFPRLLADKRSPTRGARRTAADAVRTLAERRAQREEFR